MNSTKLYSPTYNSIKYTHMRLVLQNCKISCNMGCIETSKREKFPTELKCKTVNSHITKND